MVNGWFFIEYQPNSGSAKKVGWFEFSNIQGVDVSPDQNAVLVSREADGEEKFLLAVERTIRDLQRKDTCLGSTCFAQCVRRENECWPPRLCELSNQVGRSGTGYAKPSRTTRRW